MEAPAWLRAEIEPEAVENSPMMAERQSVDYEVNVKIGERIARLCLAVMALDLLTSCGLFRPMANIHVTILPSDAVTRTVVIGRNNQPIGTFEGDFSMAIPARGITSWVTSEGYETQLYSATVSPGQHAEISIRLLEVLVATYASYSVTLSEEAQIFMADIRPRNYIGVVTHLGGVRGKRPAHDANRLGELNVRAVDQRGIATS